MNKLKVAAEELRDHLGSDSRAMILLDKLMKIANEQRTRCASLESSAADCKAALGRLRVQLDVANAELEKRRLEISRERDLRESADRRERAAVASLSALQQPPESQETSLEDRRLLILQLVKRVRRRYRVLTGAATDRGLFLEDYVKSFTNDEMMGLGMLVTVCAAMGFPMFVRAETTVKDLPGYEPDDAKNFVRWFRRHIYIKGWEDQLMYRFDREAAP